MVNTPNTKPIQVPEVSSSSEVSNQTTVRNTEESENTLENQVTSSTSNQNSEPENNVGQRIQVIISPRPKKYGR